MSDIAIQTAFRDAPRQSQTIFRSVITAMSRPGRLYDIAADVHAPAPLFPAAAAIALTLTDFETSVWLDPALLAHTAVADFLRFHTGAKLVVQPETADFALIADPAGMPPLTAFAQGQSDYPDRSTTLVLQVDRLEAEGWRLTGPGIDGATRFQASPLPADFIGRLAENHGRFPLGVDLIFTTPSRIAALPRSARVEGAA